MMPKIDTDFVNTNKNILTASHKFVCNTCDYFTSRKSQYDRHLSTKKHKDLNQNMVLLTKRFQKVPEHTCCKCCKSYNTKVGLWKHSKKCVETKLPSDFKITPEMFYDLVKQNNELQKSMIELASKQTTNNNIINTNCNNTFNLQIYLNEDCKDALNITEFVNQLDITVDDLEETGRLGYSEGVSKMFINGLQQLDVCKRPIHCSDVKREIVYIKDENKWTKEDENKAKLTLAIKQIANKNIKQITEWQKIHPDFSDPDSKQNDKYLNIIMHSMSGSTKEESDKNYGKIIKNVIKNTVIDKALLNVI
jgi:hypothetical protein